MFVLLALSTSVVSADSEFDSKLRSLLADLLLYNAQIGVAIYDITAEEQLFSHNDTLLFNPASNMKLFTSAAALELLGPSFRFKTQFLYRGKISNGRLAGDLVIVGGGDPLISGRFRSHITEILEYWADSLVSRGVRGIDGNIVVDNSLFTGPELGPGWSWDDLTYWYACPISALSFNDNCVDLKFLSGRKVGDPAIIEFNPHTDYIITHNNAYTLPAESSFTLDYYRTPNSNDITFFGGIPIDDTAGEIDYVSIHRPEIYTATIFQNVMNSRGLEVSGEIFALKDAPESLATIYSRQGLQPLFVWNSESLGVVINVINTNSQNFFAEQTLLTLGATIEGDGSFSGGARAARRFFAGIGIDSADLEMVDGSGLSYINMVKPEAVVRLLAHMKKSPYFEIYYESLANPAEDRSARNRLKGIQFRENLRLKTGHIARVNTLSGYVLGPRTKHLFAFSIMVNNYACPSTEAEARQDSILAEILRVY